MNAREQRVVITGAFGALGSAVARKFHAQGARLGLIDHAPIPPWAAHEFAAPHVLVGGVDLTDERAAAAAFAQVTGATTGLDVLVNVAGGFRWQTVSDGDVATWELMFAMNLKTALVASRAVIPHLKARAGGRIINIGAGAAARGHTGMGAYSASKAGVERLTEALADELKDQDITVNAILPGTIDTPANRADMPKADTARWVSAEAVADVIAFLASEEARAVTGAAIRVFGRG
ncbi:MAG TPA: SDR family NAD(P)-dependent oxidoreductase [Steroidobacteraceae bacterium]|nr:SDR family NAD(P)-dependent oxidoreductase [Steroidobacteraceae bacterium]